MVTIGKVIEEMILYFEKDTRRIAHFLKVYGYAKTIGELEGISKEKQYILEVAALMHDIGIKVSEEKYNSSEGKYQELEGPAEAEKILTKLNFPVDMAERVKFLIGHHHTYSNVEGMDYQILIEADFLVNAQEDNMSPRAILTVKDKIFQTKTGIRLLDIQFLEN